MIKIKQSKTADTRSCDFSKVTIEQLLESSVQHINDVGKGIDFFKELMDMSVANHDIDKITGIENFHSDFITGFKTTGWWDNHRRVSRHHLLQDDGIPADINLIDVLDMIVDCVMSGMGRTGSVYPLDMSPETLWNAFNNTTDLLKNQIIVEPEGFEEEKKDG